MIECTIGEKREIGGKLMKCVSRNTKGRVYRKGCYWVYTEKEPYKPPAKINCFYDEDGYHISKPIKVSSDQCNRNYHRYIGKESRSEMNKCLEMGGYWDGTKCYFGGGSEATTPYVVPAKPTEPEESVSTGPCPKGRQYQAPIFGNCDSGYYREKSWGRDMCICEEGASAETGFTKVADWITGNIQMVVIGMVVIVIAMFIIKVRTG